MNQGRGIGTPVIALSVVVVILAAGLAYDYATSANQISSLNNQVSTLKHDGHSFCQSVAAGVNSISSSESSAVTTLQGQIQSDQTLIATLNSTKPAGYQTMIATLNNEISQDQAIITSFTALTSLTSVGTFCAEVNP